MDARHSERIEAALGSRPRTVRAVSGGSINRAERVDLEDGRTVFVKTNTSAPPDMFPEEARGLRALEAAGGPPVPEVRYVDAEMIVLSYFAPGRLDAHGWARLGRALAALHRSTSPRHGFEADNYIGSTRQPNPWTRDGVAFYAEHRLGFQLRLARDAGRLDRAGASQVESVIGRLDALLPGGEPASLLHGDLWSGNVHAREDGVGCIVDPAAYYGFREADLAMTRLFGRLPGSFYDAYEDAWPLPAGAEGRVDLFNLYHLLNHLNLFGAGYAPAVAAAARKYA